MAMSKHQFVTKSRLSMGLAKSNHSAKQRQQQQLNCIVCTNYENLSHTDQGGRTNQGGAEGVLLAEWQAKGKGNVEGLLSF